MTLLHRYHIKANRVLLQKVKQQLEFQLFDLAIKSPHCL